MNFKRYIIVPLFIGALAKGCAKGCAGSADDVTRGVMKSATLSGDDVVASAVAKISSRGLVKYGKKDSLFPKTDNPDTLTKQAIYALALLNERTSEDSLQLRQLYNYLMSVDLSTFINPGASTTKVDDPLFNTGLKRLGKFYAANNRTPKLFDYLKNKNDSIQTKNSQESTQLLMEELIYKNFFPYGSEVSSYYHSDSIQLKLNLASK